MDVYDGQQARDKLKPDQLKTAVLEPPGLLEIAAYGYFYTGSFWNILNNLICILRYVCWSTILIESFPCLCKWRILGKWTSPAIKFDG